MGRTYSYLQLTLILFPFIPNPPLSQPGFLCAILRSPWLKPSLWFCWQWHSYQPYQAWSLGELTCSHHFICSLTLPQILQTLLESFYALKCQPPFKKYVPNVNDQVVPQQLKESWPQQLQCRTISCVAGLQNVTHLPLHISLYHTFKTALLTYSNAQIMVVIRSYYYCLVED